MAGECGVLGGVFSEWRCYCPDCACEREMWISDEMGMEEARKEKATQEHNVIDDAINDRGDGYTVFSIVSIVSCYDPFFANQFPLWSGR